ncbi:tRNA-dihydrouridine(16/17) synthase [NAD(P)(+)]-like isoform X3 [Homo sapiens]|uniref:tRNA-dihydrouridine(16/17) synthase [NAD(P)(+)]-like isoform X3 n=1 Tax=Homo sapiens TaxID=9606 RepID=UPI000387B0A0|nr:tRNA-dihydrouridine(16/17) synthase [NAD(P)(+)]-like isoform X3 [Homo sapiens]|eukprot:XP_005256450.1 tRNA-dihydrouridine(16/17) synthase [NAD(P)(+)]-like isoform X3 [Homo sapiens]
MPKLQGFEFWSRTLRGARHVVAPMVDQSELAWRLLSRRHGAQLCYTPMLHAQVFVRDANYRKENLYCEVCPEDRPLIVQFCANDPEVFVQAALLAQDYCDAIDLNLGCPQMIAKRGHYGAFLQDEWDLLQRMILLAHEKLSVPVTCKIRVFPEIDKTVRYAQMLEKAGCQLLTVHGRTKEQKGPLSGAASWEHIKAVRKAVAIPVFANGNIQCLQDVERCLRDTGVQGVMSAEGNLHNPALFEGRSPAVWELAEEYLDIVREHPCPLSYVRAHLFKLWHHTLQVHQELREELAKVKTLEGIAAVSQELKLRCQEEISRQEGAKPTGDLPFHWICQPYIRPGPREGSKEKAGARSKRALEEEEGGTEVLSKNKQKKQLRNPHKTFDPSLKPKYAKCDQCGNPKVSGFRLQATKASALGVGRVVSALLGVAGLVPAQLGLQRGSRWHGCLRTAPCFQPSPCPGLEGKRVWVGGGEGEASGLGAVPRAASRPWASGRGFPSGAAPLLASLAPGVVLATGSRDFLCPGQQMCVQPVPRLLQEASLQRDCRLPRSRIAF